MDKNEKDIIMANDFEVVDANEANFGDLKANDNSDNHTKSLFRVIVGIVASYALYLILDGNSPINIEGDVQNQSFKIKRS